VYCISCQTPNTARLLLIRCSLTSHCATCFIGHLFTPRGATRRIQARHPLRLVASVVSLDCTAPGKMRRLRLFEQSCTFAPAHKGLRFSRYIFLFAATTVLHRACSICFKICIMGVSDGERKAPHSAPHLCFDLLVAIHCRWNPRLRSACCLPHVLNPWNSLFQDAP